MCARHYIAVKVIAFAFPVIAFSAPALSTFTPSVSALRNCALREPENILRIRFERVHIVAVSPREMDVIAEEERIGLGAEFGEERTAL
jgi:hypothetical protein